MRSAILICLIILFFISSGCTTAPPGSAIKVSLKPVHDIVSPVHISGNLPAQILDNDGNLYVSYWNVDPSEIDRFTETVKACHAKIDNALFYSVPPSIDDVSADMLKPIYYKKFNSCIQQSEFSLAFADGFYPKGFNIYIYRAQNSDGSYLPVGGKYFLPTKSKKFEEMLSEVKECDASVQTQKDPGILEQNFSGFSYVNIEHYVESLMSCVSERPYKIRAKQ